MINCFFLPRALLLAMIHTYMLIKHCAVARDKMVYWLSILGVLKPKQENAITSPFQFEDPFRMLIDARKTNFFILRS